MTTPETVAAKSDEAVASAGSTQGKNDAPLETVEQKYQSLHDKIDKTARSRFIAARRLELHDTVSLGTVVVMSCCVIGLTLLDGLQMLTEPAGKLSSFVQVFCSVGVLVYSVILSKSDFSLNAFRQHDCGIELNRLRSLVYKHMVDEPKSDQYAKLSEDYASILERFDNHLLLDFHMMQIQTPSYHKYYKITGWKKLWVWCKYISMFWHYIILSLAAVAGLVYLLWNHTSLTP